MFLASRFNSFNFITTIIFSKSLTILSITEFSTCFSRNFDVCKFISPTNLKRSKLGSLGLHQKILKLCLLKISFLSF